MRRLLVILMMLLLPLQASWAVAASVCDHESGPVSHFGHHEHQHAGADVDLDLPDGGFHADCGVCHGVGTAVPSAPAANPGPWSGREYTGYFGAYVPEPPIEALLRPPLSLVA